MASRDATEKQADMEAKTSAASRERSEMKEGHEAGIEQRSAMAKIRISGDAEIRIGESKKEKGGCKCRL